MRMSKQDKTFSLEVCASYFYKFANTENGSFFHRHFTRLVFFKSSSLQIKTDGLGGKIAKSIEHLVLQLYSRYS